MHFDFQEILIVIRALAQKATYYVIDYWCLFFDVLFTLWDCSGQKVA